MTTNATTGTIAAAPCGGLEECRRAAIDALTRVATATNTHLDQPRPGVGGPWARDAVDMAGLIAGVLAAVAANVGSSGRLLAGRPDSWEADLVHQLIAGTVGHDDEYLLEHRTREVVVPLNVPDLAWQRTGFPDVDQALDEIYARFAAIPDEEHDQDAEWAAEDAVLTAYADAYRAYADAFTSAVIEAASRIAELLVPVRVDAVHDPRPIYRPTLSEISGPETSREPVANPDDFDTPEAVDPLVLSLWEAAFRAVPAPTITLPTSAASAEMPSGEAP